MTRQEITGERDLRFSQWIREKLPDSFTGFRAYDIDFILWTKIENRIGKVMILEVKTRNSLVPPDERMIYNFFDWCIKNVDYPNFDYWGFHTIRFENTFFDDGKVYFDGIESNEKEITETLAFKMKPPV